VVSTKVDYQVNIMSSEALGLEGNRLEEIYNVCNNKGREAGTNRKCLDIVECTEREVVLGAGEVKQKMSVSKPVMEVLLLIHPGV